LVHNYFGIDMELVWNVIETQLGALKTAVETSLGPQSD
jgi:uncharacterized protein with HEPN domain